MNKNYLGHSPETKISDLELNMSFNRKQSNISGVNQSLNFNNLKDYRKPTFNRYKSNSPYKSNDYLKSHQKVGPLVNLQSDLDNTIKDIQSSTPMSPQISLNKGINLLVYLNKILLNIFRIYYLFICKIIVNLLFIFYVISSLCRIFLRKTS